MNSYLFSKMIGTLAIILLVAAFVGGSNFLAKVGDKKTGWRYILLAGVLGGFFGIYGNVSGVSFSGAVISVRDIGPMLAGFTGGPIAGLIAGLICGIHRLMMRGITAQACFVATCCIGTLCGLLFKRFREKLIKPHWAFTTGAVMEALHLCIVLLMVKPFSMALLIVRRIAIPFISVNAIGFGVMIAIMAYIERQRQISMDRSRLQSELQVATVIQKSMLPLITSEYPGRSEIDMQASMEPAKEVGGDFYDFFFVDRERIAFVIADVSGKGVPAALFMVRSKQTLQECIRNYPSLHEAVEAANNSLCQSNEAEMFVTAWIGVLDLASGEMQYVCAGHNPPVLIRDGKAEYLRTRSGFVLAGMEGIPYKESSLALKEGDKLFLYTDGVTEAENETHELYGEERLAHCLDSLADAGATALVGRVKEDIARHVDNFAQFDDITMLCVRYKGGAVETG